MLPAGVDSGVPRQPGCGRPQLCGPPQRPAVAGASVSWTYAASHQHNLMMMKRLLCMARYSDRQGSGEGSAALT